MSEIRCKKFKGSKAKTFNETACDHVQEITRKRREELFYKMRG